MVLVHGRADELSKQNSEKKIQLPERAFVGRDLDLKLFHVSGEGYNVLTNPTSISWLCFLPPVKGCTGSLV